MALKWEFPGGKIEPGETAEAALVRELREELTITVQPGKRLTPVEHDYGGRSIRLIPILCRIVDGQPQALEHSELRWCGAGELEELDWAAADIPILKEWLSMR